MPIYDPGGFTGTVESLGYEELLPQQVQGTPWADFFDRYDPTRQGMAESAWSMKGEQLGEAWGLGREKLGISAGIGSRKARRTGETARARSGMSYSGTAEEMQRVSERDVMKEYRTGLQAGQSAYEQAMATGTQELAQDIYGFQEDWRREQRGTLNVLLGMDIWGDNNPGPNPCRRSCEATSENCIDSLPPGVPPTACNQQFAACLEGC